MTSEVHIKPDPYLNDGLQPVDASADRNQYLYGSNAYSFQHQQNQTHNAPPVFQSEMAGADNAHGDNDDANFRSGDSNSNEEEDIVVKRKAQNRAAQRAFRERKEQRVRDLEQRLGESEREKVRLASENERLKKENTVISTENQVLMATTTDRSGVANPVSRAPLRAQFPVHKFTTALLAEHDPKPLPTDRPSFVVYEKHMGDTMLGSGAVWEQIMEAPNHDEVDIEFVMEFLKGKEICDGFGPVFRLEDVKMGIMLSRGRNA